jgi:hypothetical protein
MEVQQIALLARTNCLSALAMASNWLDSTAPAGGQTAADMFEVQRIVSSIISSNSRVIG